MGDIETYIHLRNSGIALVENTPSSPDELRALGADASDAAELAHLHRTYFGPTRFSGKQRKARAAALAHNHGLATLTLIESYTAKVKKDLDAWNLRIKLAGTPAHKIREVATTRLKELRRKRTPKPGVRFTYRSTGPNSMTITDDATVIADIRGTLESVNKHNLLDAARTVIVTGGVGTKPAVHAQVVVTLDEFDRIINGDGDEIELQLTNGARMTGAEFLSYQFASIGYATIVHPVEGPINSYRTERSASWKQRLTLAAETQTCSRPGCNKPADYCHVHHIIPWQAGGYTNIKNLTFLCAYHNGINDDDPQRPTGRGYMYRLNTGVSFIPPWGAPITAMPEYQEAVARLNAEKAAAKTPATTQAPGPPSRQSDTTPTQPPEQPPPDGS
ncbi:HNH endonuclease signature motif containing protein [Corynebacterium singulare]|uniref:HNH endonuclease n=1 Tax=Corynebacterium singulare TaxID=161899 RepID=A0ABS9PSE1_9CORY|nr:HNH endonuclease signature motif containing protein [Corynebacterium singulare]MCG7275611.1 HNH endonuclease [Corynebacterium singulare]